MVSEAVNKMVSEGERPKRLCLTTAAMFGVDLELWTWSFGILNFNTQHLLCPVSQIAFTLFYHQNV